MYLQSVGGTRYPLQEGVLVQLGRSDLRLSAREAVCVSRAHCIVENTLGKIVVTSVAHHNPTLISYQHGRLALLSQGHTALMVPGDRLSLLVTAADPHFELRTNNASDCMSQLVVRPGASSAVKSRQAAGDAGTQIVANGSADFKLLAGEPTAQQTHVAQPPDVPHESPASRPRPNHSSTRPPVLLILVGPPGAGKSTWCGKLSLEGSGRIWQRVNQDTIRGGKRGNRNQCLAATEAALARGDSVMVDRTNIDAEQRHMFLSVAAQHSAPAFALVFSLPAKLCADRAANRSNHEGNLEGPGAKKVAYRMHAQMRKAGLPKKAEGFSHVMVCDSPSDVASALKAWRAPCSGDAAAMAAIFNARKRPSPLAAAWGAAAVKSHKSDKAAAKSALLSQSSTSIVLQSSLPTADSVSMPSLQQSHAPAPSTATAISDDGATNLAAHDALPNVISLVPSSQRISCEAVDSVSQQASGFRCTSAPLKSNTCVAMTAIVQVENGNGGESPAVLGAQHPTQPTGSHPAEPLNPLAELMASSKSGSWTAASSTSPAQAKQTWPHYAQRLHDMAMRPERYANYPGGIEVDDQVVCFEDGFPKARHHGLVVARLPGLDGPDCLRPEHIPLLRHMQEVALRYIKERRQTDPQSEAFRLGFHAVPSMRQLHMHVISQDFDAVKLKTKQHWHSFTADEYFRPLQTVLHELNTFGRVHIDRAAVDGLKKQPLACHRCGAVLVNMPALKQHISSCHVPLRTRDKQLVTFKSTLDLTSQATCTTPD